MDNEKELEKCMREYHWVMRDMIIEELKQSSIEYQTLELVADDYRRKSPLIDDLESGAILWDGTCTKKDLEIIRLYFSNKASMEFLIRQSLFKKGQKDGVKQYRELIGK